MKIRDEVLKIVKETFADGGTSGVPNDYRDVLLDNLEKYFDQLEKEILGPAYDLDEPRTKITER